MESVETIIGLLYDKTKQTIKDKPSINAQEVMGLVPVLMDAAKEYPTLTGVQKHDIVQKVILKLAEDPDVPLSAEVRQVVILGIQTGLIGAAVDKLWAAGKGLLFRLIKPDETTGKRCGGIFPCC